MSLTLYADTGYAAGAFNPKQNFPVLLTFDTEEDSAALSWGMVREAVGYSVYAGVRDDNMLPVVQGQLETTLDIGSLGFSESYAFKVVADLGDGRSVSSYLCRSGSNTVADVTVTTASQQALLAFPSVYGAIGYNIYMGSAQGQEIPIPMIQTHVPGQPWAQPMSNGFLIQGLTNDTTYYFMVQPIFEGWIGRCTEVVGVTPAIPIPQNLVATAGDGQVGLVWDVAAGACSYNIYQSLTSDGETPPAVKSVSTNSAVITGLTDGTEYFFKVTAVMCDGSGESAMSNEAGATPNVAIPTGLVARPCDGRVKLSWDIQPTASSYNIYESTNSGGETGPPLLTGITATTCTVTGLTDGQAAYFKITAVNANGESPKSNEATSTPVSLLAPVVTANPSDRQITLSFPTQSNTTYEAFVSTESGGEVPPSVGSANGTGGTVQIVVDDLIDGVKYYFIVIATNLCGQTATSAEINSTPIPTAQLSGLSWLLPCLSAPVGTGCSCASEVSSSVTLLAEPGTSFNVTFRIRGIMELKNYVGGTNNGQFLQTGGTPTSDFNNRYELSISSPAQTYYINRQWGGLPLITSTIIDFEFTAQVDAGAIVTMTANSGGDNQQAANTFDLEVDDDSQQFPVVVSQPYDGEFAQADAVAIAPI